MYISYFYKRQKTVNAKGSRRKGTIGISESFKERKKERKLRTDKEKVDFLLKDDEFEIIEKMESRE